MHEGHRKRMLERLQSGGKDLQDHEILEILLFNAIPRKNTNPIAHSLIDAFGSLAGVFRANMEQLQNVEGVGPETARYLKCLGLLMERIPSKEEFPPEAFNLSTFTQLFSKRFAGVKDEVLEVYCLDSSSRIKFNRTFTSFERGKVDVPAGEFTRLLALQRPKAIVLAHNHPDAPSNPSKTDDMFTARMQLLCSVNGVDLYDHVIFGTDGYYSYFLVGRMETIKRDFSVKRVIEEKRVL